MQVFDGSAHGFEGFVDDGDIGKRHVGDTEVDGVVGNVGGLKAGVLDVCLGVKDGEDFGGVGIKLDAEKFATICQVFRHDAEEVTDTGAGFEHVAAFEAQPFRHIPHRADIIRCCEVSIDGAAFGGTIFLVAESGFDLLVGVVPLLFPVFEFAGIIFLDFCLTQIVIFRGYTVFTGAAVLFGARAEGFNFTAFDIDGFVIIEGLGKSPPT